MLGRNDQRAEDEMIEDLVAARLVPRLNEIWLGYQPPTIERPYGATLH